MPDRPVPETPSYRAAHLRRALAEDPRTAELGVVVTVDGDDVYLSGSVPSAERRALLCEVLRESASGMNLHNDVRVVDTDQPRSEEDLL